MNVFQKFTLKSLKKNRTRTIVTIIGIILSVSMFTAVTEAFVSAQQFALKYTEKTTGSFLFYTENQTKEKVNALENDKDIEKIVCTEDIGYAKYPVANEEKPYLYISAISDSFTDVVAVNLMEGRLPENSNEIVVSYSAVKKSGEHFKVGEAVTLKVGDRYIGDEKLSQCLYIQEGEELRNIKEKTYTVVGIMYRPDTTIEPFDAPGYTVYTKGDGTGEHYTAYAKVKSIGNIVDRLNSEDKTAWTHDEPTDINSQYAMFSGYFEGALYYLVVGLGTMLILIIVFGSVALIYNTFSISVSERTKQFGLLRSVGATKKQMMKSVLFEALCLCVVAVPLGLIAGCGGLAVTLRLLSDTFDTVFGGLPEGVSLHFVPSFKALLAASVISVFTALLSAYIPARKAVKRSAIDAIRQTDEIKINPKKVKTSPLTYKLFGFPGMVASKNFKRNKKKYKATVISLFTSIVLFISASSLCSYFKTGIEYQMAEYENYDILCHAYDLKGRDDYKRLVEGIKTVDGIDSLAVSSEYSLSFCESSVLTENERGYEDEVSGKYSGVNAEIRFVDDALFKELLKENKLKEKDFLNPDAPRGVLFDENIMYSYVDGKENISKYSVFKTDKTPFTFEAITGSDYRDESGRGYYFEGRTKEENGRLYFLYAPGADEGEKLPTEEDMVWVEVGKVNLTVGAVIEKEPYYITRGTTLIYPESAESTLGKYFRFDGPRIYIKAKDHRRVTSEISDIIAGLGLDDEAFLSNYAEEVETVRGIILIINVFAFGFTALISLIATANVFNTISTNIHLRKRELAMLKSVGMTDKDFRKMMNFESILYGIKSLLYGLPVSLVITYILYLITNDSGFDIEYYVPVGNFLTAVVSVFIVVFSSMIYSMKKISKENIADALKNENI